MRDAIRLGIVSLVLILAATLSLPALATNLSQAVRLCAARGGECVSYTKKGNTIFCVDNGDQGEECVTCPPKGKCSRGVSRTIQPGAPGAPRARAVLLNRR